MQNYRLTLAYDGTRYRGWQRLPPPAKTVQASVETALGEIFGQPLEISGSGRTDAGVHAACQVASFHAPKRPTDEVLAQLRRLLPEDIGALTLDYAPERFHARLSAVGEDLCLPPLEQRPAGRIRLALPRLGTAPAGLRRHARRGGRAGGNA